ncbi:GTP diphosphokinase [Thioalkalivibrio denitrificans]|uniref:GTP pyrophosphokinase n=1 Tax=Thioalkalivibrio denitrificans TaxID=108003 RepID=A0A1V3NFP9_9GAMM|nr:bifunctional (p)ppGpp synthetase/guanosine-3',5'-bis(diphosphate) 3'-pyrophosphohydrolase [Thioalkalivibrio denitrificans]OOG23880.1 GTP diphosphokinase [Thioalkalivibrio denitrificans]
MKHSHYHKKHVSGAPLHELEARFGPAQGDASDAALSEALKLATAYRGDDLRRPVALDVAETLRLLGVDRETLVATLLLDAYMHGRLSEAGMRERFGASVAGLVRSVHWMLTFKEETPGAAAGPEQAERLRRLLLAVVEDVRAVLIKLAYRVQRLRLMAREPDEEAKAYARETLEVFAPLAHRLGIGQLKWEMEDLSFRILEPDEYRRVAKLLEESRTERESYILDFTGRLESALSAEGIDAKVLGRPKHIHSIWRKMQRKQLDFEELYDLRAVRVIVDRISTCYTVLGVVHGLWPHIPQEFDDYIANPKDNGYQSLHTAVIGPKAKVVEVQIRTQEMDDFAELGVAAHWRYKEGGREDLAMARAIGSLRRLLDNREDDEVLMDSFRSELFQDRVFVLTPRGDVVDLPKGSTPLDFAYAIHTEVGHRCRGAKVDGRIVPLTYTLRSGQRIEVLTTRQGGPSRDWINPSMGYLRTSRARAKARSWFKLQDHDRNLAEGRGIVERECQRMGVSQPDLDALARRFHHSNREDFLVAVGSGDISPAQLAAALQPVAPAVESLVSTRRRKRAPKPARGDQSEIHIRGVGNLLTQIARCCRPVPGDPIIGFITRGKGVSIHRRDCVNILRMPAEKRVRLVEVGWGAEPRAYPVDVRIEAFDRQGLLRDVTGVMANDHINVLSATTRTDRTDQTVTMELTLEVEGSAQLSALMDKLGALPNVTSVRRIAT